MIARVRRTGLWAYSAINLLLAAWFLLAPTSAATLFAWPLAPLAARFMGSLLLAGAACGLADIALGPTRGSLVLVLVAIGDLLIACAGILALDATPVSSTILAWLAFFVGTAICLFAIVLLSPHSVALPAVSMPRSLRRYFRVHLCVVLPVGLAMFLFPSWAQTVWPWMLSPMNVRLLGAFFAGAALISFWCQRQPSWYSVLQALVLYAVFATSATVVSIVHFGLFDPKRPATWAFFGLYLFVAAGAWFFLVTYPSLLGSRWRSVPPVDRA